MALNHVVLMGRITQDLELKQTPSGVSVLSFALAVERNFIKQGEDRKSDFITCIAWRGQADFISKYFAKGRLIAVEGALQTRTYDDKNGIKHYLTEVIVNSVSFTGEPKDKSESPKNTTVISNNNTANAVGNINDFEEIASDDDTPF